MGLQELFCKHASVASGVTSELQPFSAKCHSKSNFHKHLCRAVLIELHSAKIFLLFRVLMLYELDLLLLPW